MPIRAVILPLNTLGEIKAKAPIQPTMGFHWIILILDQINKKF
jgi:hypothetical protein